MIAIIQYIFLNLFCILAIILNDFFNSNSSNATENPDKESSSSSSSDFNSTVSKNNF